MKKLNFLFALAVVVVGGLSMTSCDSGTKNPPEITIDNQDPINLGSNETSVAVTGQIVAEAGLDKVVLFSVTSNSETQIGEAYTSFKSGDISTTDDVNYNFRFTVNVAANMSFKITATDKDDQTASKSITINTTAAAGEINSWTATLGGGANQTTGSFFASIDGTVYKQSAATTNSTKVDIIYHFGTGGELYAPSNSNIKSLYSLGFSTYNQTKFKSSGLSGTQFEAVTDDAAIVTAADGASADMMNVSAGDVVAFITASGKKGLLKVSAITGNNSGSIDISVKVQK